MHILLQPCMVAFCVNRSMLCRSVHPWGRGSEKSVSQGNKLLFLYLYIHLSAHLGDWHNASVCISSFALLVKLRFQCYMLQLGFNVICISSDFSMLHTSALHSNCFAAYARQQCQSCNSRSNAATSCLTARR